MTCNNSPRTGARWVRAAERPAWAASSPLQFTRSSLPSDGTILMTQIRFAGVVDVPVGDAVDRPWKLGPGILSQIKISDVDGEIVNCSGNAIAEINDAENTLGAQLAGNDGVALAAGAGQTFSQTWTINYVPESTAVGISQEDPLQHGLRVSDFLRGGELTINTNAATIGTAAAQAMTVVSGTFELWHLIAPKIAHAYLRPQVRSLPLVAVSNTISWAGAFRHVSLSAGLVGLSISATGRQFSATRAVELPAFGLSLSVPLALSREEFQARPGVQYQSSRIALRNSYLLASRPHMGARVGDLPQADGFSYTFDSGFTITAADLPEFVGYFYGKATAACEPSRPIYLDGKRDVVVAGALNANGSGSPAEKLFVAVLPTATGA